MEININSDDGSRLVVPNVFSITITGLLKTKKEDLDRVEIDITIKKEDEINRGAPGSRIYL